jgi:hypothetical protein
VLPKLIESFVQQHRAGRRNGGHLGTAWAIMHFSFRLACSPTASAEGPLCHLGLGLDYILMAMHLPSLDSLWATLFPASPRPAFQPPAPIADVSPPENAPKISACWALPSASALFWGLPLAASRQL